MPAEKIEMSAQDCDRLLQALSGFDSRQRVVTVDGKETVIFEPYVLGSARMAIIRNMAALEPHSKQLAKFRDELIRELTCGGTTIDTEKQPALHASFVKKFTEALEETVTVELNVIPISKLDLEKNAIPLVVLMNAKEVIDFDA